MILDEIAALVRAEVARVRPRHRWGTVTAVSPLRVRLDGDSTALDLTPDALGPVGVGDRVLCQMVGRRVVVQGAGTQEATVPAAGGFTGDIAVAKHGAIVHLTGALNGSPSGDLPVTLGTLPAGMRPRDRGKWVIGGSSTGNTSTRLISIDTSGAIQLLSLDGGTGLWLTGVTYLT